MLSKFVDTLLISEGNRDAINAAREVQMHRHLVFFGQPGMGKTQILNAIYRDLQNKLPKSEFQFLSADEFSHRLMLALKRHEYNEFIESFYSLDGLVIDDLEICDEKPRIQQELCGLVKHFKERGKFLILSVGRPLNELDNLDVKCQALISSIKRLELGEIDRALQESFADRTSQQLGIARHKVMAAIEEKDVQNFYQLDAVFNRLSDESELGVEAHPVSKFFSSTDAKPWHKLYQEPAQMAEYPCIVQKWKKYDLEVCCVCFEAEVIRHLNEGKLKSLVRKAFMNEQSGSINISKENSHVYAIYVFNCD